MILWFLTQESISLLSIVIFCAAVRQYVKFIIHCALHHSTVLAKPQYTEYSAENVPTGNPSLFGEILHVSVKGTLKIPSLL